MFAWVLIAAAVTLAYSATAVVLVCATLRRRSTEPRAAADPAVTVAIAARNEEANIAGCLKSVFAQDYPEGRWNCVIVDDRSTDGTTTEVAAAQASAAALHSVRVDSCPAEFGGKQNALAVGIEHMASRGLLGEVILLTDADCTVPNSWIRDTVAAFAPDVGMVAGLTTLNLPHSFCARIEQADLAHLMGVAWGAIACGKPMSAIGNNLAVRTIAYNEIGGYRALGCTIVEDCALVQRIASTRWKVGVAVGAEPVLTRPSESVGAYFRQRIRWGEGVRCVRGWRLAVPVLAFAYRLTCVGTIVCAAGGLLSWSVTAFVLGGGIAADALLIGRAAHAMGIRRLVAVSPLLSFWQILYQPVAAIAVLAARRHRWRGTEYSRNADV